VSWEGILDVARRAERSGFDSVWVSDHLFLDWSKYGGPSDPQGATECWTTMAAVAAATERVRVGSLALCNDLRSPALVAKMAGTLDVLSNGRLDIGIGGGWYEPEYEAAGITFDPPGTRIHRLGEAIEIITRMLAGEELTFQGRYYDIAGALVRPRPIQEPRPPVWVGGKGDLLLSTAAEHADGWNFSWLGSIRDTYRERSQQADRACEKVKRDPKTLRRSVGAYVLAGRDDADTKTRFQRLLERTPKGVLQSENGGSEVSWEQFRATKVVGTVAEVTDTLGSLAELGVEEVIVTLGALPFQVVDEEDVELFGETIASAL
jgi:probable F420-dependent oxidoreductase